jgi:hypothetical protein
MKAFDQTYADQDFKQQIEQARAGWMEQVPRDRQPDLDVDGLRGSLLARLIGALSGRGRSG